MILFLKKFSKISFKFHIFSIFLIFWGFNENSAKFQTDEVGYSKLIENKDVDGIYKLLTNEIVEEKLLQRVLKKVRTTSYLP